ncbi:hypothetical protein CHLNCDRAFT_142762 [Chlorella variabilis]|uniref:LysM domain-containing protein n=1 Tax=Chlorella variabilis TaxID=554065 RepID=E1Z8P3_CHLVA|nr:hypothetical protein CHLNCDRAFT_142762 [Chlorella variabilis]EFN57642.1 hypothetical protein CHLNCDRAFT_142762 [Chlorella variabilis]|eukprot:XP_005849744.1 hypothetical protein CHLNCDRAFT_142762 [Chlorella variabilis]
MERLPLRAVLLLVWCCVCALGIGPEWYNCSPANCAAPDCQCASWTAPAVNGTPLAAKDTPQFIHDDAIGQPTNQAVREIIDKHKNRNGCNMPATFFVLESGTDCLLAKAFWEQNSEIAIHSKTHLPLTSPFPLGPEGMWEEMFSVREYLNETCGIPLEDMVGFRAPLLVHNPAVRANLAAEGMLYDSSIIEFYAPDSTTSPNASTRLWPYTMDQGIPQDCTYFQGNNCTQEERYPGLWEFPLLNTQAANGTLLYSMDPGRDASAEYGAAAQGGLPAADLRQLLELNFNSSYNGNRAPFGIYVHTPWATPDAVAATNDFLSWALALNGTYAVTMRTVIEWMKDPVPVSQMDEWLSCKQVDLSKSPGATRCQVYTVKQGDFGEQIATDFGVAMADLAALNPNLDTLQIGEQVLIPPFDDKCGEGTPVTSPPTA